MAETPLPLPAFTSWDTFPFEGDLKVKALDAPVDVEPARKGEEIADCKACQSGDDSYIWVNERWRVRSMDRPTGLPMILILEPRSHLDIGDLPNLLAAELGVMTVRVERAIRSLDDVARVHVNRWGDGAAHLHLWFMARPKGQLQLRGSFLPMWDDILPPVEERKWREDLALVAAWLADFGGTAHAQPPRIEWQAPSSFVEGLGALSIDPAQPADEAVVIPPAATSAPETPAVPATGGAAVGGSTISSSAMGVAATTASEAAADDGTGQAASTGERVELPTATSESTSHASASEVSAPQPSAGQRESQPTDQPAVSQPPVGQQPAEHPQTGVQAGEYTGPRTPGSQTEVRPTGAAVGVASVPRPNQIPGQALPSQAPAPADPAPVVPSQPVPGQAIPGQAIPGQAIPGQAV